MKNLGLYNNDLSIPRKQDVDGVSSRVSTNEDNIATLDSDMEAAKQDITTLKGNVTTLTNALGSKQDKITGGASTIADDNLTENRVLVSDDSGKVAVSNTTNTELGYLGGVTSAIQTQLNGKVPTSRTVNGKDLSVDISLGASDVGALPTQTGTKGQVLGFTADNTVGAMDIEAGGGTTIVLSATQPSSLKAGDYWYQIIS